MTLVDEKIKQEFSSYVATAYGHDSHPSGKELEHFLGTLLDSFPQFNVLKGLKLYNMVRHYNDHRKSHHKGAVASIGKLSRSASSTSFQESLTSSEIIGVVTQSC